MGQAKARSLEVTTVPEPGSILLEQWTISAASGGQGPGSMSGLSLLQAVRSYLHFSQLSAWYSKTGGTKPWNILIRITLPGEEFSSKFSRLPEQHYFPPASVRPGGSTNICVSVRSLPRSDDIPAVICSHNTQSSSTPEEEEETKLGIAGALAWRDQTDLRRTLVKSKLVSSDSAQFPDCPVSGRLTKSDSMDSMLGDSLIDPPQSLSKMPPKRYQSPSRCGSPSLEAPEPLMGYRHPPPSYDQAMSSRLDPDSPDARLNRHDLLRRRDLTHFYGLHPRLFHGNTRLTLPVKPATLTPGPTRPVQVTPVTPCRARFPPPETHQDQAASDHVVNDRMPVRCTISGKHICQFEEEVEEQAIHPTSSGDSSRSRTPPQQHQQQQPSPSGEHYRQEELGAKAKGWTSRVGRTSTPYSRDSSSDSSEAKKIAKPSKTDFLPSNLEEDLHQDEVDNVLNCLKSRHSPTSFSKERLDKQNLMVDCLKSSRRPSFEEIFEKQNIKPSSSYTQVYRSEISTNNNFQQQNQKPDKSNLLLEAILRPLKTDKLASDIHSARETCKNYCSQSCDSSADVSPLSPVRDQLFPVPEPEPCPTGDDSNNNNQTVVDINNYGCEPWLVDNEVNEAVPESDEIWESVGDLCQDMQNKCLITRTDPRIKENVAPCNTGARMRSYSETCRSSVKTDDKFGQILQPLDYSFDEFEDSWSVLEESLENLHEYTNSVNVGDKRRKSIDEDEAVPSANKKNAFRKSFDSAASMVFQRRTGLPLTSSPAPMRRGIKFDFDSGINTPKDIKRALFEAQSPEESECGSPKKKKRDPRRLLSTSAPATISSNNLLCNFEESVLNGRLEPVSTVEGFTAEIGASGSFQPKHLTFPVTVFFYTLCENSNYASPYLVSSHKQYHATKTFVNIKIFSRATSTSARRVTGSPTKAPSS